MYSNENSCKCGIPKGPVNGRQAYTALFDNGAGIVRFTQFHESFDAAGASFINLAAQEPSVCGMFLGAALHHPCKVSD